MNKIENAELSDRAVNQISDVIIPMIKKRDKEIERLNNIINEIESYLEKTIIDGGTRGSMTFWYKQIYDYLQELKGKE